MAQTFTSGPGLIAGATIAPCTLLSLSTAAERTALTCGVGTGSTFPIAIAGEGQKTFPGATGADTTINAIAGDFMHDVKYPGTIAVAVAGTGGVTKGARVESDANGNCILLTGSGNHNFAGIALAAANAGEKFPLDFLPGQITL